MSAGISVPVAVDHLQGFLMVLCRLLGMFMVAPFWAGRGVPMKLKAGLALFTAFAIFPYVNSVQPFQTEFPSIWAYVFEIGTQLMIGLILGFISSLYFVIFGASGRFYSMQMGFGIVNVFDPFSQTQISVMGQLQTFIGLLFFIALDGPNMLLIGLQKSFVILPSISFTSGILAHSMFSIFSKLFAISFVFVLPLLGVLFIIKILLGLLSKVSPQLNVMIMGFPITIGVGMMTFIILLQYFQQIIPEIFAMMYAEVEKMTYALVV